MALKKTEEQIMLIVTPYTTTQWWVIKVENSKIISKKTVWFWEYTSMYYKFSHFDVLVHKSTNEPRKK